MLEIASLCYFANIVFSSEANQKGCHGVKQKPREVTEMHRTDIN